MLDILDSTRTRVKEWSSDPLTFRTMQQNPGEAPRELYTFTSSPEYGFKSITDSNHPRYAARIKKGEYIASPFTVRSYAVEYSTDVSYLASHPNGTQVWNTGSGPLLKAIGHGPELPTFCESREAAAKLQALAAIDTSPMDVAEDIGELLASATSIASSMAGILSAAKNYRSEAFKAAEDRRPPKFTKYSKSKQASIDRQNAKAWMRSPANHWAAYRFGFLPMMSTINSALMALSGFDAAIPIMRTATGTSKSDSTYSYEKLDTGQWLRSKSRQIDVSWRAYIHYKMTNPCSTLDLYNIRKKAIPATLWAIVPYSFMIDRVVDVSSGLKALSNLADPSVQILGAGVTRKGRVLDFESATAKPSWNGWTQSSYCEASATSLEVTRTLWRPTIWDAIPVSNTGKLTDTVAHCADLAALIAQQVIK